jgi:Ca2+-binding EF-hand superfamily protein
MPSTRDQVIQAVTSLVDNKFAGDWHKAFNSFDLTGKGSLNRDELTTLLAQVGVGYKLTRWAIVSQILNVFDLNNDGLISWDEFSKIVHV